MGRKKSPNIFHPVKHSAVGSKNSLAQEGRDQDLEFKRVVDDSTHKVVHKALHKLPKEALERLDVMSSVKEKLYNYVNQNMSNMLNRYLTTAEDEMAKKYRDMVDKEENKVLNKYTPRELAEMIDQIAGPDRFNNGEVEKAMINTYGHLHGHINREVTEMEQLTNSLLRQKTDVGAFVRGQNFYSVVKCAFKDDKNKPKTVMNVKLSINIHDQELISPIYHHQTTVEFIAKELVMGLIQRKLDKEIEDLNNKMIEEGKAELDHGEQLIKKMHAVENYTSDERDDEKSKRYSFIAKHLMERLEGLGAEINPKDYDALNIRENIKEIIDEDNIRARGFNTSINCITSILDTSKLGYQYCENMKNVREFIIREYEDTEESQLPDERYQIRLKYYDLAQLLNERRAYDKQVQEYNKEVRLISDIVEYIVQQRKVRFKINDYAELVNLTMRWRKRNLKDGETLYEDHPKLWGLTGRFNEETRDIVADDTDVEKSNRTYVTDKKDIKQLLILADKKLAEAYGFYHPKKRILVEERIRYLSKKFEDFDYRINPYHVQPGVLLDMDIVTCKRKKFIMGSMANVLNEFLAAMSKGFSDAAFAEFSRRRSTTRDDLDQVYVTDGSNASAGEVFENDTSELSEGAGAQSEATAADTGTGTGAAPAPAGGGAMDEL